MSGFPSGQTRVKLAFWTMHVMCALGCIPSVRPNRRGRTESVSERVEPYEDRSWPRRLHRLETGSRADGPPVAAPNGTVTRVLHAHTLDCAPR